MIVKRYEYRHGELSDEHYNHPPAGEFVRWEDYAALLARYTLAIEQQELLKTSVKMYENRVEGGDLHREKNETIKRLKAATQWRPIETAPKKETVWVFGIFDLHPEGEIWTDEYPFHHKATHWMPLPKPPSA